MAVEQIVDVALRLPSEARAVLADRLAESPGPAEDGYVGLLWVAETLRRGAGARSERVQTIPAGQALAQVRRALDR